MRLAIAIAALTALLGFASAQAADTNAVASADSVAALRAENEALRRENQRLRRELVRRNGNLPVIDLSKIPAPKESPSAGVPITDDGGFWLSGKGERRHNSKCRYYKQGNGRPCKGDEGTPCKICGG